MPRPTGFSLSKPKSYVAILLLAVLSITFYIYLQSLTMTMTFGKYSIQEIYVPIQASECEKSNNSLKNISIILAETSGKTYMTLREVCSVESAALHNPNQTVTLYSLGTYSETDPGYQTLKNISNVEFKRLNLTEVFARTPMEEWYKLGIINTSAFPVTHLSDAIRIALLWKHGGVYMDMDVITLQPLDTLQNALSLEFTGVANGAVIAFDQWNSFIYQCMVDYVENFSNNSWGQQGPLLFTRLLQKLCGMQNINDGIRHPELCQGVTILPTSSFYPITYDELNKLFDHKENNRTNVHGAYTVHLWNNLTKNRKVLPGNGTFLEVLAQENCPSTYNLMFQKNEI